MDFLKLFSFPLTDLHLSGRCLLWFSKVCSLVKFLYKYCLCVNQLYRKKKRCIRRGLLKSISVPSNRLVTIFFVLLIRK